MNETHHRTVLAAIHDFALTGEWPAVLRLLGSALNCHYAAAVATTPDRNAPQSLGVVGVTAEDHQDSLRTWHKRSPYGSRWPSREAGAVVVGQAIVPRDALLRSAMYRRYLAPRGIQEVVRLDVLEGGGRSQCITLGRPWSAGPFTAQELGFARALMPDLQRAAAVQARLGGLAAVARSAFEALEAAQGPVLLLDSHGRIVHVSAACEGLLREADGLSAGPTGLRAATPALTARLAALVVRALGVPGTSGALRLPRPSGRPDLMLIAVPLRPGAHHPAGACGPAAVLQVLAPLARAAPDPALLMEAFELTRSEAALAIDLLQGLTVGEVAARSGRSVATVRTHLAHLLAKTGTARQSELLRLLAELPRASAR
jgi:DNA-binding CsgD family transcriptional regulator